MKKELSSEQRPAVIAHQVSALQASGFRCSRLSLQLSGVTAFQILFSFAVQWVIIAHLGASVDADALFAGYTIPQVIISLGIDSLVFVLVPLLASRSEADLVESGWQLFIGIGVTFLALAIVLRAATPLLIHLMVPGLSTAGKQLATALAKIQVLSIVGAACYALLTSLYQVRNRFLLPALCVLLASMAGLGLLLWKLPSRGVYLAAWIQLLINTLPALLLLPVLGPIGPFRLNIGLIKQVFRALRPLVLGAAYYRSGIFVDRLLASFLMPGSIVIQDMCGRVHIAIARMINQGLVTPVVPVLSRLAENRKWDEFRAVVRVKALNMFLINATILAGIVLGGFAVRHILPAAVLRHVLGNLSPQTTTKLVAVFLASSGLVLFSGLSHIFATAYYSEGDTVTPTKIGAVSYTVGLLLKVVGFFTAGLIGIALATSLHSLLYAYVLWCFLEPGKISSAVGGKRNLSSELSTRRPSLNISLRARVSKP